MKCLDPIVRKSFYLRQMPATKPDRPPNLAQPRPAASASYATVRLLAAETEPPTASGLPRSRSPTLPRRRRSHRASALRCNGQRKESQRFPSNLMTLAIPATASRTGD